MFKAEQQENAQELREVHCNCVDSNSNVWYKQSGHVNTLWTGDADLRLYIKTVQDG
jgi:hypothetical protein